MTDDEVVAALAEATTDQVAATVEEVAALIEGAHLVEVANTLRRLVKMSRVEVDAVASVRGPGQVMSAPRRYRIIERSDGPAPTP